MSLIGFAINCSKFSRHNIEKLPQRGRFSVEFHMNRFFVSLQISSSRSASNTAFEHDTKSSDGISISSSSSTLDPKLEEIVVNQAPMESSMSRSDVRKSKSKVRSYLKKCKDALYGHASDEMCSITVNEDLPLSSNTSWYLTTDSNESANNVSVDQLPKATKTNRVDEQEEIDNEVKCTGMTETMPLVESQVKKVKKEF
jgi:hypothetical protein